MRAAKPRITTLELWEPGESGPGFTFVPQEGFDPAHADRAASRIGPVAYAALRSQVFSAAPQLHMGLQALVNGLESSRLRLLARREGGLTQQQVDLQYSDVGKATHWQAITQYGVIVENLAALLHGLDAYRSGRDVAAALLDHDLDLLRLLNEKGRGRLSYWEGLLRRPSEAELAAAGLDREEVRAMRSGSRDLGQRMLFRFREVRGYYTPALHSVYTRYKHGYSLITPHVSPLRILATHDREKEIDDALRHGFAVMHQRRHDGRRVLQVVRTGADEVVECTSLAMRALELTSSLAHSWLMEVEHPEEHALTFAKSNDPATAERQQRAMRTWIGPTFDAVYELPGIIGSTLIDSSEVLGEP